MKKYLEIILHVLNNSEIIYQSEEVLNLGEIVWASARFHNYPKYHIEEISNPFIYNGICEIVAQIKWDGHDKNSIDQEIIQFLRFQRALETGVTPDPWQYWFSPMEDNEYDFNIAMDERKDFIKRILKRL